MFIRFAFYVLVQVEAVYDDNGILLCFTEPAIDEYFVASVPDKHNFKISMEIRRERPLGIVLDHNLAGVVPHFFIITSHGLIISQNDSISSGFANILRTPML